MQSVLVTGGAGYIGAHVAKTLAAAGYFPVSYDNLSNGHAEAVRWGPLVEADLLDEAALDAALERYRPVAAIHLAGLIEVGRSMREPELFHRVNVEGSRCLLRAMARAGVGRIVFSSSAAVYGEPERTPIPEDHPLRPASVYGETKLRVEEALAEAAAAGRLRYVALRYFNAAGADPDGEIGERHEPETHALPLAIEAALGGGGDFRVFGTDYPTPDGTAVRDYVDVGDLARAHLLALRHLLDGGAGGAVNLGTGQGVSVAELVATVARLSGRPLAAAPAPRREGDPAVLVAAAGRAAELLGWRPRSDGFESIVRGALAWHRSLRARRDV